MVPILAGLISTLASNGLGMIAGAIQAKGKEVIEEKLGVKIPDDETKLTPELLQELKIKEMEHEEFLIEAQIRKAEVSLKELELENANTADARKMNLGIQTSDSASHIAKVAAYYLDFLVVSSTLVMAALFAFNQIPAGNKELAYMALGSLLTMCGTILNFHRGTSASSKSKDDAIHEAIKKGA